MQTRTRSSLLPVILGSVIGMILGSMLEMRFGGVMLSGALGAVAMQLWRLQQRVEELSDQIDDFAVQNRSSQSHTSTPVATPITRAAATAPTVIRDTTSPPATENIIQRPTPSSTISQPPTVATTASPPTSSNAQSTQTPPVRRYVPPPPSAFELQMQSLWKWLTTRNPIALAAVAISFLGGVFLVKYAAEHSHFPIEYRFIALSVVTITAVIFGWRIHNKNNDHKVFAQVLQGGGVAGLYLTVFAATRIYQLLPAQLAFVLMAAIAFASAVLAVTQSAMALAIIGTVGGFLTPILVSTGGGSHIALFTYYALLNFGVFTVAWFRTWRVLNVLSFAFTFSITALWRGHGYQQTDWLSADLFLLLFFLTFVAISVLNALRQAPNLKGYVSGSLVFGLPVAAFSLHASLVNAFEYALAWSALGMAMFYVGLAYTLHRQRNENFRLLIEAFAALAVIFASLAIPLAFNRHVTAAMWSFEGAGMIWLGLRTQRKLPRFFGVLLQISAGFSYLHFIAFPHHDVLIPLLNGEYLGSLLLCGTAWFSAWLLHNHQRNVADQPLASYEQHWSTIALLTGCFWWVFGGLREIAERLPELHLFATLLHASIVALILWFASRRWPWKLPGAIALLAPGAGAFVALTWLLSATEWHPFADYGFVAWPLLFVVQYSLLLLSDRAAEESDGGHAPALIQFLHTAAYLSLTILLTWECQWQIAHIVTGVWSTLSIGLIPACMLWLTFAALSREKWPVVAHPVYYRIHVGTVLTGFLLLWTLLINVSNEGDPVVIRYIPLLNPLDITTLLLFITVIKWWNHLSGKKQATLWGFESNPVVVIAGLLFIWMNSAVIRTLHYYFDVPLTSGEWFHSTLVQTTLSIFWMILTLVMMIYASRKLKRPLWITGFVLMLVVIAKMLTIDLSATGTLSRIVSFLTVGALLFIVSYFSPLPPAIETEKSPQ